MSICFAAPSDPNCNGPKPDVADSALTGHMCEYCVSLRDVILKTSKENRKRIRRINRMKGDTSTVTSRKHKQITEEVEKAIRRVWRTSLGGAKPPCKYAFLVCGSLARREPVTYSDIDALLVLEKDDPATRKFFTQAAEKMQKALAIAGGQHTQFKFCPGGLSPVYICGTPESVLHYLDEQAELGNNHVLGAMQTRMVYGDQEISDAYEESCYAKLRGRQSRKSRQKPPCNPRQAIANIEEILGRKDVPWSLEGFKAPEDDDLVVNLKSQLYRPVHLVVTELGLYYGVPGWSTREILANLAEAGHMSVELAHYLFNLLDDVGLLRIERQLEAGTEYELVRLREITRNDTFEDERDRDAVHNEPLANWKRIAAVRISAKRVRLFWEMTEHFVEMSKQGMVAKWDAVGRIQPMKAAEFRKYAGLKGFRKKSMFSKKPHVLQSIHDKLVEYHGMAKPMIRSRHMALMEIRDLGLQYLSRKSGKSKHTMKARTVATVTYQADKRLTLEQTRAQALSDRINKPTRHVKPVGGHGAAIRFERVAKPGGTAVSGVELMNAVEQGPLQGQVELSGEDEKDLYAMKKLLKTLDNEKLLQAGLKKLEYADDKKRAAYRVIIEHERLIWAKTGKPVDTMATLRGDPPRTALYSMDLAGRLYARNFDSQDKRGEFAHSSLLAGDEAICAGCIKVKAGRLIEITNTSGHYQPEIRHLLDVCREICDVYDPIGDGYALIGDFRFELEATRRGRQATGHYRIPLLLFCDLGMNVPDIVDFEVHRHDANGTWKYVNPRKAERRGGYPEDMSLKSQRRVMRNIGLGTHRLN